MKKRATLFLLLAAAVAGAFWMSACVSGTERTSTGASPGGVVINADGIVLPGTEISQADREAMNQILNKYDKRLYRIDTYENGKRTKTQGKLTDVVTDRQLASQIAANVKKAGFTQCAVQIRPGSGVNVQNPAGVSPTPGSGVNVQNPAGVSPTPGSGINVQNNTSSAGKPKSDDLVERLKPILKKYQKK